MPEQDQSQRMLECEARYWLRRGYTTPERLVDLREVLKKRGDAAIETLIEEMRTQWKRRLEWLEVEDA